MAKIKEAILREQDGLGGSSVLNTQEPVETPFYLEDVYEKAEREAEIREDRYESSLIDSWM